MRQLALFVVLLGNVAFAQVPNVIGYQGRLLQSDGTPVTGTATMTFTFYDADTAGTALWTETQTVALTDGFYATFLGSVTALPANLFNGQDRFLEVTVNGTALAPRLRAGSVPHALAATSARDVSGGTVNAQSVSVSGVQVIDASGRLVGPAAAVTQLNATPPLSATTGSSPTITLNSCATGEVLKWNGAAWACAADDTGVSTAVSSVTAGDGIIVTGTPSEPVVSVAFGSSANSVVKGDDDRLTPAGSVTAFLGNTAPPGWVMANGGVVSRSQCAGLFAVIGTTYGAGDGSTTFATPNLNDRRFLMGRSAAETVGDMGGSFNHTHSVANHVHGMAHAHSMAHDHNMLHNHYMDHTHVVNAHAHGTTNLVTGNGGSTYTGVCSNGTARSCGAHSHNVTGATDVAAPGTSGATLQYTGNSPTNTGGSSAPNTGGSSNPNTNPAGAGATGAANPPYFAVNFIIKC